MRLSLRAKWTIALLLVGALPISALAVVSLRIQRAGLAGAEKELQVAAIEQVAGAVRRELDDAAEATHRVGRLLTEGRVEADARLELSREAMARAGGLLHVAVYDPQGKLLDAIARAEAPKEPAPLPRVPAEAEGAAAGAWLAPEHAAGGAALRYAEAIARDGERRAWVIGTLRPGALVEHLAAVSSDRFGAADRVLLLDEGRRVVASAGAGPLAPGASLGDQDLFASLRVPEGAFRADFGLTTEFRAADGTAMVGTLRSVRERGWAVVVRRPEDEAYGALAGARRASLLAAALAALGALGLGAFLAARTTRPVRALVELTRAYARREFGARSPVKTGDELEALGASMAEMADRLAASEAEVARRARAEADLVRYVPQAVARAITGGEVTLSLGGRRRVITALFADLCGFTAFAEASPPDRVAAFLNELFTVLTEVVFRHEGSIDKFMGDCMLALFGAVADQPDQAARALAAAEDMQRFVEASAPAWRQQYGIDARLAVGIDCGEALVGNLGSELRMDYTAIGEVVNVASHLERLAKPGQTLVTGAVARAVRGMFVLAPLGAHPIGTKSRPVEVFELR